MEMEFHQWNHVTISSLLNKTVQITTFKNNCTQIRNLTNSFEGIERIRVNSENKTFLKIHSCKLELGM